MACRTRPGSVCCGTKATFTSPAAPGPASRADHPVHTWVTWRSTTTLATARASRLDTSWRWCIRSTPVAQRDLHRLVQRVGAAERDLGGGLVARDVP